MSIDLNASMQQSSAAVNLNDSIGAISDQYQATMTNLNVMDPSATASFQCLTQNQVLNNNFEIKLFDEQNTPLN